MANEAAVTVVLRMRDEASAPMEQFGDTTQQAQIEALQFNAALTAMGSAMTAVGSLLNQIDDPMAKMAGNFLMTGGAILTTTSAVIQMIPYIRQLIGWIRNLAIAQAVLQALSGPSGWVRLGVGVALAGAATAGILAATGGFSGGPSQVTFQTQAFMGSQSDARQFSDKVQRFSRSNERVGR